MLSEKFDIIRALFFLNSGAGFSLAEKEKRLLRHEKKNEIA